MLKKVALIVGCICFISGLLGFVPGFSGYNNDGQQLLLGIFATTTGYNIVSIVFGVAGLAVALSTKWSKIYLIAVGAVSGLAALIGFSDPTLFGLANVNTADNWANLAFAIIILGAAFGIHPDYSISFPKKKSKKE